MFEVCPLTFDPAKNRHALCIKEKCGWWVLSGVPTDDMVGDCAMKFIGSQLRKMNDISTSTGR